MRPVWVLLAGALGLGACAPGPEDPLLHPDFRGDAVRASGPAKREPALRTKNRASDPGFVVPPPPTPTPEPTPVPEPEPESDPGPAPTGDCALDIDEDGFFVRELLDGTRYVGFLPPGYSGEPTRLFVGLHGCGEDAEHFAEWAVNPEATRASQEHIGISVEDDSRGGCWSSGEIPRVLHAIEDVSRCVYVHQKKIVVGGYSSGGELAYEIGLVHASRFAGILVENTTISRSGAGDGDIENADWALPIAHVAHTDDSAYPIEDVREDWARLREAGFPLQTIEVEGDHDGTTEDWLWLLPKMAEWESP